MFRINALVAHSSTANWQDASYMKYLEMIALWGVAGGQPSS